MNQILLLAVVAGLILAYFFWDKIKALYPSKQNYKSLPFSANNDNYSHSIADGYDTPNYMADRSDENQPLENGVDIYRDFDPSKDAGNYDDDAGTHVITDYNSSKMRSNFVNNGDLIAARMGQEAPGLRLHSASSGTYEPPLIY